MIPGSCVCFCSFNGSGVNPLGVGITEMGTVYPWLTLFWKKFNPFCSLKTSPPSGPEILLISFILTGPVAAHVTDACTQTSRQSMVQNMDADVSGDHHTVGHALGQGTYEHEVWPSPEKVRRRNSC